ncbi:RNA-directed DNA polymerase from mobile element jockey [Elysia marginata]|uniref:RNA-directed DNA polymerase from mobile element jockey n=1 Tax=Elysia marginata TaxID=1093978 RepID=A0AAV4IA35_9GAST|nr:RNA-directed DNA polymerase from mobile element jockey [Elysia marginata]
MFRAEQHELTKEFSTYLIKPGHKKNRKHRGKKKRIAMSKDGNHIKNRNIQFGTKVEVLKAYVWSVMVCSSECWRISKEMEKRLLAVEMWFLRRTFIISWTEKKTNQEVLRLAETDRSLL